MKTVFTAFLIFFSLNITYSQAFAWGERGHNTVGYVAARLVHEQGTPSEKAEWDTFFVGRTYMLGHLNNIPDISWRDDRRPDVTKLGDSNHFFDAEFAIKSVPNKETMDSFLTQLRNLDTDFTKYFPQIAGAPNFLAPEQKLNGFTDVGIAPWRIGQMYDLMVSAYKCAKNKEPKNGQALTPRQPKSPFRIPILKGTYVCSKDFKREEDIAAAIMIGGTMGHYIADLSQPLHTTADYDGLSHGQGGVHRYFETFATHMMSDELNDEVKEYALDEKKRIWKNLQLDPAAKQNAVKLALHLTADSFSNMDDLIKLDAKVAVLEKGTVRKLSDSYSDKSQKIPAKRRDYTDKKIIKAFESFAIKRLATGATVLAFLLKQAWDEGGRPYVKDLHIAAIPYPLDVPFILPPQLVMDKLGIKNPKLNY